MKSLINIFLFLFLFTSCSKVVDDTNNVCISNCTTFSGKFRSVNNEPVANIKISLKYIISGSELGGGSTRKILNTISDENGNFGKTFYIKDSELGNNAKGYFLAEIDDLGIDVNKYIRTENLIGSTTTILDFAIHSITKRDTIIDNTFYIPKKAYIKVNLNNFIPQQSSDYFEVQTLYPFGAEIGFNTFLNSPFNTGFSGYGNFRATGLNTIVNVFVAEAEKNIIRVFKRKNGINSYEDFPLIIPPNNSIVLTYNY